MMTALEIGWSPWPYLASLYLNPLTFPPDVKLIWIYHDKKWKFWSRDDSDSSRLTANGFGKLPENEWYGSFNRIWVLKDDPGSPDEN